MDMNVSHSDAIGIQCDRMIKHRTADIKTEFFPQSPQVIVFPSVFRPILYKKEASVRCQCASGVCMFMHVCHGQGVSPSGDLSVATCYGATSEQPTSQS